MGKGGAEYPQELNQLLGLQYDMTKQFQPMTAEWAKMGNAYMGIPTIGGTGTTGSQGGFPSGGYKSGKAALSQAIWGAGGKPPSGGNAPQELESMPALRDMLFQPGGTNELLMRRQGETSRGQILESLPMGGVQQNAIAQQRRGENENLAGMRVDARRSAANTVLGGGPMITPFTQLGGAAGQTAATAANAYGNQQAAKGSALGGLGQMLGSVGSAAMPLNIK